MGVGCQHNTPAALTPGKTRYPLYRRLGGPQGRSGRVRKISPPPGFDRRTVQPVASRYTDWDIVYPKYDVFLQFIRGWDTVATRLYIYTNSLKITSNVPLNKRPIFEADMLKTQFRGKKFKSGVHKFFTNLEGRSVNSRRRKYCMLRVPNWRPTNSDSQQTELVKHLSTHQPTTLVLLVH